MVADHNTLGRQLIASFAHSKFWVEDRCELRAQWDQTRVLLASRIYSSSHGGRLPSSTSGFLSILGAWPTDPFSGSPMIYNPEKGVVYSVGKSLVDHGGDVESKHGHSATDLGLSLRPAPVAQSRL